MDTLFDLSWHEMFSLDTPFLEIFIRGTIMYLALFFLLRLAHGRQVGDLGISDILVIVLIADAAQNGMAGEYKSITDGIILVCTIIFWNFLLDYLSFKFRWIEKITCPDPLPLVKNGKLMKKNMRSEMITTQELMSQLRQEGIEDIKKVRKAFLEGDGKVSVIKNK